MNQRGWAKERQAPRPRPASDSNTAGGRHDTPRPVTRDQQWRQELADHPSAAVRELLGGRPVIWQSDVGEASAAWHALAVTDRFVVAVDLTMTDTGTMRTFASVVRFIEIADLEATSHEVLASIRLRFGSADRTVPWPRTGSSQQALDELAFLDAVTSHLAS